MHRPKAADFEIGTNDTWNYALVIPSGSGNTTGSGGGGGGGGGGVGLPVAHAPTFDPAPSAGWSSSFPFDDSGEYPFSIKVSARQLHAWGYWEGSKITAVPPPSPVKCSSTAAATANAETAADCGDITELRLVPFGSTNIRMSVFPWLVAPAA